MVAAAERTGKKLTIGYQSRFRSDSEYLKKVCERGDLGEIYLAKARISVVGRYLHGACSWTQKNKAEVPSLILGHML